MQSLPHLLCNLLHGVAKTPQKTHEWVALVGTLTAILSRRRRHVGGLLRLLRLGGSRHGHACNPSRTHFQGLPQLLSVVILFWLLLWNTQGLVKIGEPCDFLKNDACCFWEAASSCCSPSCPRLLNPAGFGCWLFCICLLCLT